MAEYDLAFGKRLAETAALVAREGLDAEDAKRTVLYLSQLSSEILLKALLEKAGMPVHEIRKRSHNLKGLLEDLGVCKVLVEIRPGSTMWCPATRLRACIVDPTYANATVGVLLEAEEAGASRYPAQIRYGNLLKHFPIEIVVKMPFAIAAWAEEHWSNIRVS